MSSDNTKPFLTTGILLILFSLFFGVTYAILGPAINWPDSLGGQPSMVFPLIAQNHAWVILGYYSFILSSLMLIPIALFVRKSVDFGGSAWADAAVWFAALAAVFKVLGIFRWLFLMPGMAAEYTSLQTGTSAKDTIELIYKAFNLYTDGFGTHLGDQLLTGIWIGTIGVLLLKNKASRWLGILGIAVFLTQVFGCVSDFFYRPNPFLAAVQSTVYVWTTLFGILIIARQRMFRVKEAQQI